MNKQAPLLAEPIASHTPESYLSYVTSLYDETAGKQGRKKAAPADVTVSVKEGKVKVIRVRRTPEKFVWVSEIEKLAKEHELSYSYLWNEFTAKKRKIEIRFPKRKAPGYGISNAPCATEKKRKQKTNVKRKNVWKPN